MRERRGVERRETVEKRAPRATEWSERAPSSACEKKREREKEGSKRKKELVRIG